MEASTSCDATQKKAAVFVYSHDERMPIGERTPAKANSGLLSRQALRESNARSYPRRLPIAIKSARGCRVIDSEGQVYLDCLAGAGALPLGHNHPEVVQAICQAMTEQLPMQTLDLTTPIKDEFVETLFAALPKSFAEQAKIQFCSPSGADAVEAAIKLAKTATGRSTVLAFHGAYHGMTHGSLALTGNLTAKSAINSLMPDVHFLPYPYPLRCPFGNGARGAIQSLYYIRHLLSDPESGICKPAAIILEVIQGEGGVIPAPAHWLRGLRDICTEFDIPMIVDEIQTGLGRTGNLFAFEYAKFQPDILLLSKAIGGGLPLSLMLYKQSLDQWQPGAHAGTFRGNQLAMVAGKTTLEIIQRDLLSGQAAIKGRYLKDALQQLAERHSFVAEVRGRGLMIGIEFCHADGRRDVLGNLQSAPNIATAMQAHLLSRGVIVETGGRHGAVLRLLSPLIISDQELNFLVDTMAQAMNEVQREVTS